MVVPEAAVFTDAGLQPPLMAFVDTAGKEGAEVFWQNGPMALNVGVMPAVMVTVVVVVAAEQPPAAGMV